MALAAVQFFVRARSLGIAGEPTIVPHEFVVPPSPASAQSPGGPASAEPEEEPPDEDEPDDEPPPDEDPDAADESRPGPASFVPPDPDPLPAPAEGPEGPEVEPHAAASPSPSAAPTNVLPTRSVFIGLARVHESCLARTRRRTRQTPRPVLAQATKRGNARYEICVARPYFEYTRT
jgi:hypothetical protein